MIKCAVEKKRTKSPESMRWVWDSADCKGPSGELSPGTSLGTRSCKRNKPTWTSAACKVQPSSSHASCLSLLAAHASHTDSTTVAGPGGKRFSSPPEVMILYANPRYFNALLYQMRPGLCDGQLQESSLIWCNFSGLMSMCASVTLRRADVFISESLESCLW